MFAASCWCQSGSDKRIYEIKSHEVVIDVQLTFATHALVVRVGCNCNIFRGAVVEWLTCRFLDL